VKLLVSDFDLTFFDNDYDNNIKLVNEFVSKGNIFVIATGRPYSFLKKDIQNKKIDYSYLICTDGGTIYDKDLNLLNINQLDNKIAKEIIDLFEKSSYINNIFVDLVDEQICGVYGLYEDIKEAEDLLNYIMNTYNVSGYLSCNWINIISKDLSKINGIEFLKEILNIRDKDIYTIGDAVNDISMIKKYNGYKIGIDEFDGNRINNFKELMEILNKNS